MKEKPVKYIFICTGRDCKRNGSKKIRKELLEKLKANGMKNDVQVIRTRCMGQCRFGPNIIFNNHLVNDVDEKDLDKLISQIS